MKKTKEIGVERLRKDLERNSTRNVERKYSRKKARHQRDSLLKRFFIFIKEKIETSKKIKYYKEIEEKKSLWINY